MGSVAGYVAAHADCPVIVVRGPLPAAPRSGVIVVAGRNPDAAVLEFAFAEAALRRLLLVTHAKDLAEWEARHPGVRIQPVAGQESATLMVIGRKRAARAGVAGFLLQHAPCPVAVVGDDSGRLGGF
jgi:nucleotide-binding universal stress UspA family protein